MSAATKPQCSERVPDGRIGGHICTRLAKVERQGEWYCGQHDPVAIEERSKIRLEKWEAKWEVQRAARDQERRIKEAHPIALRLAEAVRNSRYTTRLVADSYFQDLAREFQRVAGGGS